MNIVLVGTVPFYPDFYHQTFGTREDRYIFLVQMVIFRQKKDLSYYMNLISTIHQLKAKMQLGYKFLI